MFWLTYVCLTSVCLVGYIGPNSRTERPRKTKICTDRGSPRHTWLGHHFQGQKSRSPGRFTHRGLNAWGRCSGDRENVLGVGNYCYVASARRRARCWGAHVGRRVAGAYCVATRTASFIQDCCRI